MREKLCEFCSLPFIPKVKWQKYCNRTHKRICPVCNKEYIEDNNCNLSKPPVACSYACRVKRTQATSMKKYGIKAPGNNPDARQKSKETMLKRYGGEYTFKSKILSNKVTSTLQKKYGVDNAMKNELISKQAHDTTIERYGMMPWHSKSARLKQKKTHMERYGVPYGIMCESNNSVRISNVNKQFGTYLKSLGNKFTVEFPIENRLYDFNLNNDILVEINPTYTHNVMLNPYKNKNYMNEDYHIDKTKLAEKHGYRCIHIWDWDDWDKLKNILIPITHKIHARKCKIYKLHKYVGDKFLGDYHLQGSCRGQLLYLGLVYGETLLQVMTFGKSRYNKNYDIELMRMCTLPGYSVIGGSSKLFSFATKGYGLNNIITYCDRSKFTGGVYEKMGMKYSHTTPPQEIWSKEDKYITSNLLWRYGYDKLFRVEKEEGKTNIQYMIGEGWMPMFDCGKDVYIYRSSND